MLSKHSNTPWRPPLLHHSKTQNALSYRLGHKRGWLSLIMASQSGRKN